MAETCAIIAHKSSKSSIDPNDGHDKKDRNIDNIAYERLPNAQVRGTVYPSRHIFIYTRPRRTPMATSSATTPAGTKPTNPKDILGSNKIPIHLWPETATLHGALALLDGTLKYGRANWRAVGVRSTIYTDAIERHLAHYKEGLDKDPDSGLHPLAHLLADAAILLDAEAAGKLNDDRQYPGGYCKTIEDLTPMVAEIKARHADKHPKHYTIADAQGAD